jgi:galactose mutarotase-like enzyme
VLTLRSQGKHLPFNFEKTVRLNGNQLLISYKLQNTSAKQFRWLWSSHPLLTIHPGDRILLPPEVRQVFIDQSHTGRLGGFGSRCSWPIATDNAGRSVDLSRIEPPAAGTAEKYFTPRLKQGWCALHSPSADCSSCFRFDPAKVPFVGIWVNQGGWPQESALRHYTVALEPCNGAPDSLLNAVEFDQANTLGARETANWEIEVELQSGPPRI